ncbi:MAG: hypothetical protein COA42_17225 [Alteromonadaceae bacterium]|nr:MAG: hypothetical protein COA42_17225 [Alteromonadaceae bacterium]
MKIIKLTTALIISGLLFSCATQDKEVPVDGLDKPMLLLGDSQLGVFLVNDRNELKKYSKIIVPLIRVDALKIMTTRDRSTDISWENVSYEDILPYITPYESVANKIFKSSRGPLTITDEPGENTLRLDASLIAFRPNVHFNASLESNTVVKETIRSYGDLKIRMRLVDSKSGKLVAFIEDDVKMALTVDSTNTTGNMRRVWKQTFKHWLSRLRSDIKRL